MNKKEGCEHEYVYKYTVYTKECGGTYYNTFKKIDYYFCKFCLEEQEKMKVEDSREKPDWYQEQ